jgi:O-antigen/teichoic acid export membrane protein
MSVRPLDAPRDVDSVNGMTYWTTRGFWAVVDQALFAVSNLIVNLLLARWLSPREYGAFVTAYVVLILVSVAHGGLLIEPMMVVGPSRFARRFNDYFSFVLRLHWVFSVAVATILLLIGGAAFAWGAPLLASAFVGMACAAPFVFLSWLARRACYVERRPAVAALGGSVYLVIAGLGAVVLYNLGLLSAVAAQLLMGLAAAAAAGVILLKTGHQWLPGPPAIDTRALVQEHWSFFRWAGGAGVLSFAQGLVFYLVLPLFGGLEASAALRAMTNFVMPVLQSDSALAGLIAPELARARRRPHDLSRIVRWAGRLFALEGALCWVLVAVFRHDLVRFVYGEQYIAYADLLLVLGALPIVSSRVNMLGAVLRVKQRVRQVFWSSAVGAGASLLVGLATLATFGAYGAVVAMITADLVRIAVMTYFVGKPGGLVNDGDVSMVGTPHPPRVAEVRR